MKEDVSYDGNDLVGKWKKSFVALKWLLSLWIHRLVGGSYVDTPEYFGCSKSLALTELN